MLKTFQDGTVLVHTIDSASPNIASTIYELGPDLTIRHASFSDSFWEWHRRLEKEGKIAHRAETCPQRQGLTVQPWMPTGGWESVPVMVR